MKWTAMLVLMVSTAAAAAKREHLAIISPDGTLVATVDGDESSVTFPAAVAVLLQQPDRHFRLTHNHPRSSGLSGSDLAQLAKPAVDAVEAIGADGSRYEATRGPSFRRTDFLGWQYRIASSEVRNRLRHVSVEEGNGFDRWQFVAHLTALALRDTGAINYRATLGFPQGDLYWRHFVEFGRITQGVAADLRLRTGEGGDAR